MLDCWNFKADQRPSFIQINEKLCKILEKYEKKKIVEEHNISDIKTRFVQKPINSLGLDFNSFNSSRTNLLCTNDANITLFKQGNNLSKIATPERTSSLTEQSFKTSSTISTPNKTSFTNIRKLNLATNNMDLKRFTRQSESEDSQYFSGTDTSLVYADSSNFSTASSNYSNYTILPISANKAATLMCASISQNPPSPPAIKHFSKLLNVASAAYNI
jgi:hypothetical protein